MLEQILYGLGGIAVGVCIVVGYYVLSYYYGRGR